MSNRKSTLSSPSCLRLSCALILAILVMPSSPAALAWEVGVEAGAIGTSSQYTYGASTAGDATFGIILNQPFHLTPLLVLGPWEDFQTPFLVQASGAQRTASYWAVDVGLRFGFDLSPFLVYSGVIGQLLILNSTPDCGECHPVLNDTGWAIGGDLGLDLAISFLRVGLELRYLKTFTPLSQPSNAPPGSVGELQGLGSVRVAF
jgi:hypothetical protein